MFYYHLVICCHAHTERWFQSSNLFSHPCLPLMFVQVGTISILGILTSASEMLQSHVLEQPTHLSDIQHTSEWRKWYSPGGIFQGDKRGVALGFATDGVNPCKTIGKECSTWPLYVKIFNLLPEVRNSMGHLMLCGVIEGEGKKEPQSLDPFMQIIVHELQSCSGERIYDAFQQEYFHLNVAIVRLTTDFMGRCKLFQCVGPMGLRACPWCRLVGFRCRCLGKTVFVGNRRYLSTGHPLRAQEELYPYTDCNPRGGLIALFPEERQHPGNSTHLGRVSQRKEFENATTKLRKAKTAKESRVHGPYAMLNLPYHDELKHTHPDGMHVIKQSFSHLIDMLTDSKKATRDR